MRNNLRLKLCQAAFAFLFAGTFTACAMAKDYSTRAELRDDPGSKVVLMFKMPIKDAYPLLRDMTVSCLESRGVRVTGDKPGANGMEGSITIATSGGGMFKSKILATVEVDTTEDGGTRTTIYSSSENPPEGLVKKFHRWIEGGEKSCAN